MSVEPVLLDSSTDINIPASEASPYEETAGGLHPSSESIGSEARRSSSVRGRRWVRKRPCPSMTIGAAIAAGGKTAMRVDITLEKASHALI
jgi:hypothetical protein